MHTIFLLSALLLAAAAGGVGAVLLHLAPVGGRRSLALSTLAAPPFVLGAAAIHLVPGFWITCVPLTGWDQIGSTGLLLALGGIAAGAFSVNLVRVILVERLLVACPPFLDRALTMRVALLAQRLGINPPSVRTLEIGSPMAVTGGLRHPTIVLSRWMVEQFDSRELEAVLAHELAHLARRDHLTRWLGRFLRDATIYLPSSWYALQILEAEEELGADALAVDVTRRPLAMASALGKVWASAASAPPGIRLPGLLGYAGTTVALLEERLNRLIDEHPQSASPLRGRLLAGASLLVIGNLAPRLLAFSASMLLLVCSLRPL